jgi:NAD(P)-dependent dehydrogenase (short-subunit alcohol dehydrogenase family)
MMAVNPFSLRQRKILVTGASSGIGRETAIQCSKMGAVIIATGRNYGRLNQTMEQLEGTGHQTIIADITADLNNIIDLVPMVDGVVHSAGILSLSPFTYLPEEELQNIMNVNFFSPVFLTQQLLKQKKINKNSSIVFISSLAGNVIASKGNSAYCASKSAISGLVKVLALEQASRQIRVNCILPGMVRTELMSSFLNSLTPEQFTEDEKKYPLGYGKPQDVANAAIYLLSDASRWVTGASLILDGGFSLQ